MIIDIKGMDKALILRLLYNNSTPLGLGIFEAFSYREPLSIEESEDLIASDNLWFDYLHGRVMKIDLSGDQLDTRLYDRDNGRGKAIQVLWGTWKSFHNIKYIETFNFFKNTKSCLLERNNKNVYIEGIDYLSNIYNIPEEAILYEYVIKENLLGENHLKYRREDIIEDPEDPRLKGINYGLVYSSSNAEDLLSKANKEKFPNRLIKILNNKNKPFKCADGLDYSYIIMKK